MGRGEKREAGWDELFIAIWENAVQNDYEEADQVIELLVRKHKVKRKEEERVEIEIREFKEVG